MKPVAEVPSRVAFTTIVLSVLLMTNRMSDFPFEEVWVKLSVCCWVGEGVGWVTRSLPLQANPERPAAITRSANHRIPMRRLRQDAYRREPDQPASAAQPLIEAFELVGELLQEHRPRLPPQPLVLEDGLEVAGDHQRSERADQPVLPLHQRRDPEAAAVGLEEAEPHLEE